jgi:O-antigen/teichoic acid export membrane protein
MATSDLTSKTAVLLKVKALRVAGWSVAGNFASQFLRLASNLVVTRILMPEAFGLMVIVTTVYVGISMFSDLGIRESIIRTARVANPRFLGTAWIVQILRGLFITVLISLIALGLWAAQMAHWLAPGSVYGDPLLAPLIAVTGLCATVQGFESLSVFQAERDMTARRVVALELLSHTITVVLTIAAAWLTGSVWGLVFGTLAGTVIKTALSHVMLPRPALQLRFCRESARGLMRFGKWIMLSSIIGFLASNGEKLILGTTMAVATFGVFAIASNLQSAIVGVYSVINARVTYPLLNATDRELNRAAATNTYRRAQRLIDVVLGLIAGGVAVAAPWIVTVLYDARYVEAGWMLQALAVGLVALRYQVLEQFMLTLGKPQLPMINNACRALVMLICIPVGSAWYGDQGAIWGAVAGQFGTWPASLAFQYQERLLTWWSELLWLPAAIAGASVLHLVVMIVRSIWS